MKPRAFVFLVVMMVGLLSGQTDWGFTGDGGTAGTVHASPGFSLKQLEKKNSGDERAPKSAATGAKEEDGAVPQELASKTREAGAGRFQWMLGLISEWQKQLRGGLTKCARDMRDNPYGVSFWMFLALSFGYGAVHGLGPGHGKSIVCFYFLSRRGSYLYGVIMANLIAFIHVGSAVFLVLVFYLLFQDKGMGALDHARTNMEKISYALLVVLGLLMVGHKVYELRNHKLSGQRDLSKTEMGLGGLVVVGLATGLIPCPGAAIILIFSITLKVLVPGLIAMVCIACGMGLTTTVFAAFTIASRETLLAVSSRSQKLFFLVYTALSITAALLISILGALLLFHAY